MQFSTLILIILLFYDNIQIQNYKLYIYAYFIQKKLENNSELKIVTFIKSTINKKIME